MSGSGEVLRLTLAQRTRANFQVGPTRLDGDEHRRLLELGLGRIARSEALLHLGLAEQGAQLLRNPFAEPADAGLGMLPGARHCESHRAPPEWTTRRLQAIDFSELFLDQSLSGMMADREGFEPPIPLRVCRISSAVHSTTLPPVRGRLRSKRAGYYTRRSAKTSLRSRAGRILSRAVFAASHSAGFATLSLDLCDPSDYRASSGVGKPAPDLFWPFRLALREPGPSRANPDP